MAVTAVVGSAGDYYVKVDPGYGIQSGDTYTLPPGGCDVCEQ